MSSSTNESSIVIHGNSMVNLSPNTLAQLMGEQAVMELRAAQALEEMAVDDIDAAIAAMEACPMQQPDTASPMQQPDTASPMQQPDTASPMQQPDTSKGEEKRKMDADGAEWFRTPSSRKRSPKSFGGKNMDVLRKSRCLPSPSPSTGNSPRLSPLPSPSPRRSPPASPSPSTSQTPSAADEDDGLWMRSFKEEQQRRVAEKERRGSEDARQMEWLRQAARGVEAARKKLEEDRALVAHIKGQRKSLREQREALKREINEKMKALDAREEKLDRQHQDAVLKMKRRESMVAKFNEFVK